MSFADSPLQAALDQLRIPQLGAMFYPDWRAGKSCKSPFREDQNASFSVFDNGSRWRDFSTGEHGDAADFVAMACGLSPDDGARRLIELAGVLPAAPVRQSSAGREDEEAERARKRSAWPAFEKPSGAEIRAISGLRCLSPEGVGIVADRGLLFCCDSGEGRAWVVTDATRRKAQARRMDGKPWERVGAKAWTLPGSGAAWPIGLREASSFPAVALCEGGPDLLGAVHLAWCSGVASDIAPVSVLGAANRIPDDALALFAGRRVRIFGHADEPGQAAAARWAGQLAGVGADVDGFDLGGLLQSSGAEVDDVCDFSHLDVDEWERHRDDIEQAFSFAARCHTRGFSGEGGVMVQAGACEATAGKGAA